MHGRRNNRRIDLLSVAFGAAAGGAALPLFALLIWLLQLPVTLSGTFSLLAFGFGCLISGITAGRLKRQYGLVSGVKSALLLLLLLTLVTLVMGNLTGEFFLGRGVVAVLCGAVGGVIGVNKR
ncbi:MAG: TIGR04086 family membrane protein [Oscillospiraceae bacterium]|nr:TIGR04086 family membrane protein [Oscillospiraceae bacterium]